LTEKNSTGIIGLFRRSTNSAYFIPEIDGLRFYAIITVVIFHLNTAFSKHLGLTDLGLSLLGGKNALGSPAWWLVRLDLGVKVFFAISGMVLALPFLRQYLFSGPKVHLSDYFYRRLTRLEPPFIVSLVVFLLVHALILHTPFTTLLPHFWAGLAYAHVFIYGEPNPINPVTWSLETEAQFYVLVPLFFGLLFFRKNLAYAVFILLLAFLGSVYLRGYFIQQRVDQLGSSVLAYFSNFLVGIVFAWWYLVRPGYFQKRSYMADVLGAACIFGQFYVYKPQHLWHNNMMFNLFVLGFMVSAFKGRLLNRFFTRPWVYIIGGMCYSIYLLHYALFHLIVRGTAFLRTGYGYGYDLMLQMLVCIPVVLVVSGIFYILIEKPCMNKYWPQHLTQWLKVRFRLA